MGRGPDVHEQRPRHVINFKEFEARGCICPAPKVPCGGMPWCKSLVARTNHVRPNHSVQVITELCQSSALIGIIN